MSGEAARAKTEEIARERIASGTQGSRLRGDQQFLQIISTNNQTGNDHSRGTVMNMEGRKALEADTTGPIAVVSRVNRFARHRPSRLERGIFILISVISNVFLAFSSFKKVKQSTNNPVCGRIRRLFWNELTYNRGIRRVNRLPGKTEEHISF